MDLLEGKARQRSYLPGNSGSRQIDVPVLDWDKQGLDYPFVKDLGKFLADSAVGES